MYLIDWCINHTYVSCMSMYMMRQNKSDMYTSTYINDIHLHISCLMDQTTMKDIPENYDDIKLFWWFTNTSELDNNFCCLKTAFQDLCFVQDDLLWAKPQGEKMEIQQNLRDFVGSSRWWQRDINRFIYYNICHMFTCIQKTGMCVIYMPSPSNPIQTHRWKYEQLGVFWITTTWTSWYSDTKNRQTSVTVFDGVAKGELNRPWWITGKFWQTCIYAIYIVEPLLFGIILLKEATLCLPDVEVPTLCWCMPMAF